jgi:tetratricopeptide (TPR) repeat protein
MGAVAPENSDATSSRRAFGTIPSVVKAGDAWTQRRTQSAVRHALRVIRDSKRPPDLEGAYHILCAASADRGDFDTALGYCDQVVDLTHGEDWRHLNNRGNVLLRSGSIDAAAADYAAALALLTEDETHDAAEGQFASLQIVHGNLALVRHATAEQGRALATTQGLRTRAETRGHDPLLGEPPPASLATD